MSSDSGSGHGRKPRKQKQRPKNQLNKFNIPTNSEYLALEEYRNGRLHLQSDGQGVHCPIKGCGKVSTSLLSFYRHAKWSHLDGTRPRFEAGRDFYQPKWLEGTEIYVHRPSNRAICRAMVIVLQKDEIIEHIYTCCACREWRRPYIIPSQSPILNKMVDVLGEDSLPGGWYFRSDGTHVLYRLHEPFHLLIPCVMHTPSHVDKIGWGEHRHVGNETVMVQFVVQQVGKVSSLPIELSFTEQLLTVIDRFLIRMDMSTMGFGRAVADRIGQRQWLDDTRDTATPGYWFATDTRNQLDQNLPCPLLEAVPFEAALAGMGKRNINIFATDAAKQARVDTQAMIKELLQVILGFPSQIPNFLTFCNGKGGDDKRDVVFSKTGQMHVKVGAQKLVVPWFAAELVVRFLFTTRQMQQLYDGPKFATNQVFNGAQRPRNVCDRNMSTVLRGAQLHDLGEKESMDWRVLDKMVAGNGPCLVDYYKYE